jgi:hypothetical protein
MPDVIGMDFDTAKVTLQKLGLKIDKRSAYSSEVPKDQIISSEPEAGTIVQSGYFVQITVSMGENGGNVVPNFVGTNIEAAKVTASGMKINLEIQQMDSDEPKGMVISQSVTPGDELTEGMTIRLYISGQMTEIQLFIPAGVKAGKYELTAKNSSGVSLAETVLDIREDNAGGKPKFTIPLPAEGDEGIQIYVTNQQTGEKAEVGSYIIRSDSGEYETVSENVEEAFRQIGAL